MELFAGAVLAATGGLLVATDVSLYRQLQQGHTMVFGKQTLLFAVILTIAYYLSLAVVLF